MTRRLLLAAAFVVASAGAAGAIEIVAPASGTVVRPGQVVAVRVAPSPGQTIESLSVAVDEADVAAGTPVAGTPGAFEANVRIPRDAVGPTFVVAFATLADGDVSLAMLELQTDPGPLRSLLVSAPPVLRRIGEVALLTVKGFFEDGVVRDLTDPALGTSYAVSDAAVLGLHPSGLIQARRRGAADLTVESRGVRHVVRVQVAVPDPPDNTIPVPNPGPDRTVAPETLVRLDGSASADADGDALRYRWQQTGGRYVTLFEDTTATPAFIAPFVEPGEVKVLEFALVVIDARGATSLPATVRVTVRQP
jgi:hypothetical protein